MAFCVPVCGSPVRAVVHLREVGEEGLDWMREIQQELGLRVMTEVALPCHVEAVRKAGLDMIWIGARTTVNPFMMHELAEALRGCDMPVWVKNPVCPDVDLWIGAVERLQQAGLKDIRIIHRGFCTVDSFSLPQCPPLGVGGTFSYSFS